MGETSDMPSNTPERLRYLEPVFEALKQFDPEELGDDNPDAMVIVEQAMRGHTKGMKAQEIESTIQADCDLLQEWSNSPEAPDTAAYVLGVYFGMLMYADFDELI